MATAASSLMPSIHSAVFSDNQLDRSACVPTHPPRHRVPVTISNPSSRKKAVAAARFRGDVTRMLFVGSGKYPREGPFSIKDFVYRLIAANLPPALASSAYQDWCTRGVLRFMSRMRGRIMMPQPAIANGSPCVTPSLLRTTIAMPSLLRTINMLQCRYELKTNRAPEGQRCRTVQSITTRLPSLKAFRASTNRNPHCSSCWCCCQSNCAVPAYRIYQPPSYPFSLHVVSWKISNG